MNKQVSEGFDMMHPNLQKNMPLPKLQATMDKLCGTAGKVKSITFQADKPDASDKTLLTEQFKIECENCTLDGTVRFEFAELRGHILAFNVTEAKP